MNEEDNYRVIKVPARPPEYYSQISKMRKTFSGGKTFKDLDKAREAQRKSVESRKRNAQAKDTTKS